MAKKGGSSFGNFLAAKPFEHKGVKPIITEFSRGSVPNSIAAANRESAWSRWRRGYEMATASFHDKNYTYKFKYTVPFPEGLLPPDTEYPDIQGAFQAFPTVSREFKVHWAGEKNPGSVRFDQTKQYTILASTNWFDGFPSDCENIGQWLDEEAIVESADLYIESITEDANYWYVKLHGNWSPINKLPPPLYIDLGGALEGLKPLNGEVLEDRIIYKNGPIIERTTINPDTQTRYGYVQAVLIDTDEENGILKFKKAGSVEATPDNVLVTPATRPPMVGRYLITGPRYACTCQDFTHREYSYLRNLGSSNKKAFPRTSVASIKPGRYEVLQRLGIVDNSSMTDADVDRILQILAPNENLQVGDAVTTETGIDIRGTRDNPGVYREFGSLYLRSNNNPGLTGSKSEGMPKYEDYTSSTTSSDSSSVPQIEITSVTDIWVPVLDEMRYCKHIYAMRFQDHVFPPEPSDFPVEIENMAAWEQKLVAENQRDQQDGKRNLAMDALSYMDVPPYNCQAQAMQPMIQRLFNIPLTYIKIDGFTMYDKNNQAYVPALGEKPGT
jgi:hypothetical protein